MRPSIRSDWTNGESHSSLAAGLLAGGIAGLAMTLAFLLLRFLAGMPLLSELGADRTLPLLPVNTFLHVLGIFGGPMAAKEIAYFGSFVGQVLVGVASGLVYAIADRRGLQRLWLLAGGLLGVWLAFILFFLPVLDSNYRGLPSSVAPYVTALGLMVGLTSFTLTLGLTYEWLTRPRVSSRAEGEGLTRRRFLYGGSSLVVLAVASAGLIGKLFQRGAFVYDGMQTQAPLEPITPVGRFYVVTKNLIDPYVDAGVWRLGIEGSVERPVTYDLSTLRAMAAVVQESSMECISNGIGYHLLSNANWKGVRLADLLAASHPKASVVQIVLRGADGYMHTMTPAKAAEPSTLVAYEMNGEPLLQRHGAPVRIVIPSSYGEMSVKWLTDIRLVDHGEKGYYEQQGWKPDLVHTMSRIDFPKALPLRISETPTIRVTGVAFAGIRGIREIQLSTDGGGSWQPAAIDYSPADTAWTLWHLDWRPNPGDHLLVVRARDGTGEMQIERRQGTAPDGATGYHKVKVRVEP
jgi:DMSO/TMAO reductase YedYZ molybdopterin-dependent catalytic subunit